MSLKFVLFLLAIVLFISSSSVIFPFSFRTPQVEETHPRPSSSVSAPMLQVKRPQFCNWLVQTWPIGYCYENDCKRINILPEFTIHGLWPVDSNGRGLEIPINRRMDNDDICAMIQGHPRCAQFSKDMVKCWPTLMHQYNVKFWSNEWNKHGSCQNSLVPEDYFVNTIKVVSYINLKKILADKSIVPSNSHRYPRGSYITAIEKKTQARPLLLCNPTRHQGFPVLSEVVICVNARANSFVPCPVQPTQPGYKLCLEPHIWFLV